MLIMKKLLRTKQLYIFVLSLFLTFAVLSSCSSANDIDNTENTQITDNAQALNPDEPDLNEEGDKPALSQALDDHEDVSDPEISSESTDNTLSDESNPDISSFPGEEDASESENANEEQAAPITSEMTLEEALLTRNADIIVSNMSLHEKVCQLIIVKPKDFTGESRVTAAGDLMKNCLEYYPVGGFIYEADSVVNASQISLLLKNTQSYSTIPLIQTLDEEGGRVSRIGKLLPNKLHPMLEYKDLGVETAYSNASYIAYNLKYYGFNMDLAPVADVWSNPVNTVIGDRAYSDDFAQAALLIPGAVQGFHSQQIACCLKHFPGHGDSSEDSHYGAAYIHKNLDVLRTEEFLPFKAGIDSGADAVMIGHLIVDGMGDEPVIFNSYLINDILRKELGFRGVVISDSLQMKALTDHYGVGDAAIKAVNAGCDILLMPKYIPVTVTALEEAVANGTISESRIDESVKRIIELKIKYGLI